MLYECSCGWQASTATAFYRHLQEAPGSHQLAQTRQAGKGKATSPSEPGGVGSGATGRSAWQGTKTNSSKKPPATNTVNPLFSRPLDSSASGASATEDDASDVQPSLGSRLFSRLHNITSDNSNHAGNAATVPAGRTSSSGKEAPPSQQETATAAVPKKDTDTLQRSISQPDLSQTTAHPQQEHAKEKGGSDDKADVEEIRLDLSGSAQQPTGLTHLGSFLRVMGAGLAPFRSWTPAKSGHLSAVPVADDSKGSAASPWQAGHSPATGTPAAAAAGWDRIAAAWVGHKQDGAQSGLISSSQDAQAAAAAVGTVEALLMWHNPWASARVLGAGLYGIVCMHQLTAGSLPITPATLLLGCAFLLLMVNLTRLTIWRVKYHRAHSGRHPPTTTQITDITDADEQPLATPSPKQVVQRSDSQLAKWVKSASGSAATASGDAGDAHWLRPSSHGGAAVSPSMQHAMDEEARVYAVAHALLARAACMLVPALAGSAALVYRALSGRRLASSALTAGCLWLGMLLGELHLVNSAWFAAALWLALFCVPWAYVRSRAAADHLVEDLLRMAAGLLVHSERSTLLAAGACCAGLLVWGPAALIARVTTAMAVGFAVLLYPHVAAAARARSNTPHTHTPAAAHQQRDRGYLRSTFSVATAVAAASEEEEALDGRRVSNTSNSSGSKLPPLPMSRAATVTDAARRVAGATAAPVP